MAHAELTEVAAGEAMSPRRRSLAASLEAWLGMLVEIPAALLVVAEIVILFAGVVARYGLHRPLIWSDELASILFLWLAMLGAAVAFRRAEHMRMTAVVASARPAMRAYLDVVATCSRAGLPAADRLAGLRIRLRRELHHHAGAADLQCLAGGGAAGRDLPDGAVCVAAAGASRRYPDRAGRGAVGRVGDRGLLAGAAMAASARQYQPDHLLCRRRRFLRLQPACRSPSALGWRSSAISR